MEKLDEQINTLQRDKLVSLIQENAVRVTKITIKFTKNNKKNTLDRWRAFYDSYDRLLRSVPRDITRVEREIRKKFNHVLPPERIIELRKYINQEAQLLVRKMEDGCREEFQKLGAEQEFLDRLEKTQAKLQESLEEQLRKCEESLVLETGQTGKLSVDELCKLYEIKESLLHELNMVGPLQNINIAFNRLEETDLSGSLSSGLQESLRFLIRNIQDDSAGEMTTVKDRKDRKMQVARESLALRDVVVHCQYLLDQVLMSKENRNLELSTKIWNRLQELLETGRKEWLETIPRFKMVFEYLLNEGEKSA